MPVSPARVLARLSSRLGQDFFERLDAARLRAAARGDVPDPAVGWIHAETVQATLETQGGALWRSALRSVQAGDHSPDVHEAFAVPALAHWRHTRGLYEFDVTLTEALTDTPLDEVPLAAIRNLPEYAPYIALNGLRFQGEALHGAWVLRFVGRDSPDSLQIVLHRERDRVWSISLTGGGTIREAVDRAFGSVRGYVEAAGGRLPDTSAEQEAAAQLVSRLLGLVLYLCSDEPDVSGTVRKPQTSRRRGATVYDKPQVDNMLRVGFQHGGAIRMWRELGRSRAGDSSGLGAGKAPHFRRAHWHLFWTGKGRTVPRVRWVHPVAVNVRNVDDMPVQVRPVLDDPADGHEPESAWARENAPVLGHLRDRD